MSDFNFDDLFDSALASAKPKVSKASKISIDPSPQSEAVAVNETVQDMSQLDTVAISAEINALGPKDAKNFKHFCAGFKPIVLPKGAQKAFAEFSTEMKIVWLFLRWKAMSNLMFLSGHVDLRELTDDELDRCIHFVVSTDAVITDVREIPVSLLGFELNSTMRAQVEYVLANSPRLFHLFPDRLQHFTEAK
jgi:hypothetical protein